MGEGDPEGATTIDANPPLFVSELPAGTWVGRYVLIESLGQGGMGAVYSACDSELDRRVALKVLRRRAAGADADAWSARLMREAKAMARLSHPNVVTLYDVGLASDGRIFLAMEVVDGGTLGDWLEAAPRSWREIVALLCEAGEGLAAAHRAGMIHRDFKPANVLVGKDGRARVTDFGLARSADEDLSGERPMADLHVSPSAAAIGPVAIPLPATSSGSLPKLTVTGTLMGTPGYMAPEQYPSGVEIDARADVFAFCATLYRALYREKPFDGKTVEEIGSATLAGKVREAPRGSDVPAWVHKVLLWGLAVNRDDRPASMTELLAALRADPRRRRRWWLAAAGVAAATCAIGLSVHAASARRERACHAMADRLGGVWDGARKGAIAGAFRASGVSSADATWARVEKRLDAYAAGWTSATEQACAATRIQGEQSEAMLDLRMSCLDERLDDLRALSDVFAGADARTVDKAVQAASSLSSVEPCSNLDQLSVGGRLPSEPAARAEIRALQAEIASARELVATNKLTESAERLEAIHGRVEAASYGPALLAWTMVSARTIQWRDMTASAKEWERAIALAESNHLDREKAESEMRLGRVLNELGRHEDAHLWLGLAAATLARGGGDPELALTRDVYEGWTYRDEAKYPDAVRILEPAIARANTEHVNSPFPLGDAQSFLGLSLLYDPERFDEAVTHARAAVTILEDAVGPEHLSVAAMVCNLAVVQMEIGRLDDALSAASRSVGTFQAAVGRKEVSAQAPNFGNALLNRGEVLVRMGRAREAVESVEQARAIYVAHGKEDSILEADIALAAAWAQLGNPATAAGFGADARTLADKDKETAPDLLVELLVVEARRALDRGEPDVALARAESALALAQTGVSYLYDLSSARLVLARAIDRANAKDRGDGKGKADLGRARSLAEQARDGFSKLRDQRRADEASALLGAAQ
jgi:tetratricopeptide (TPR) repeat protein